MAPPQDLQRSFHGPWPAPRPEVAAGNRARRKAPARARCHRIRPPGQNAPGTVVRGDFLSQLLHRGEMTGSMILIGLFVAFGLGAMHALSPGHGKTIVAAYLVGYRGTFKHAIFLGAMVTFTHTFSVFCLGLATLFLFRDVLPENMIRVLGAISGLSIVWIGAMLSVQSRARPRAYSHDTVTTIIITITIMSRSRPSATMATITNMAPGPQSRDRGDITFGSLIALGAAAGWCPVRPWYCC